MTDQEYEPASVSGSACGADRVLTGLPLRKRVVEEWNFRQVGNHPKPTMAHLGEHFGCTRGSIARNLCVARKNGEFVIAIDGKTRSVRAAKSARQNAGGSEAYCAKMAPKVALMAAARSRKAAERRRRAEALTAPIIPVQDWIADHPESLARDNQQGNPHEQY